jgi:hypothetical protein
MTDSTNNENFSFNFSLEVLNHLGRGLYRSFATVIAEAVSNSWDAEATEVSISIDENKLIIEDNGKGMDDNDFGNKFLKVGYSRRQDPHNKSKRNVIGRKGIGKLAMLSISEKVTIISKTENSEITGGVINNSELDKEIAADESYSLDFLSEKHKSEFLNKKSGTKIIFEDIKTKLNSVDIIRKYLATQFNFIFSLKKGDSFLIEVNSDKITEEDLKELDDKTQFIWFIGAEDTERVKRYKNLYESIVLQEYSFEFESNIIEIKGFIASVKEPKNLLLRGSKGDFKAGINLFSNGRLRQEDLFQEITSKQLPEEYLYGEIHVDGFEDEKNDRFTSSREGIIKDDPLYQKFLDELKKIQITVLKQWNALRIKYREEAEAESYGKPKYEVRMEQSRNQRAKEFEGKIGENIQNPETKKALKDKLKDLSYENTLIYQDLFILENIFREYIKIKDIKETDIDSNSNLAKVIRKVRKDRQESEGRHILEGKIAKEEHYLNYLDLIWLSILIDDLISEVGSKNKRYTMELTSDTKEIYPIRNVIMHTNEITDEVANWPKIKKVIDYIEKIKDES